MIHHIFFLVIVQGVLIQSETPSVQTRLVDGGEPYKGRVEVWFNGEWGTVCHDRWNKLDAGVICHELGFPREGAIATGGLLFGQGTGPIFLDEVACNGAENNLRECQHSHVGEHDCRADENAGVICANDMLALQVRLADNGNPHIGRVEVQVNGVWGTICNDRWNKADAKVICRELGLPYEKAVPTGRDLTGIGTGPIYIRWVQCTGGESRLRDCNYAWPLGVYHHCDHIDDVGVACSNDILPFQARIIDGSNPSPSAGRVEVLFNGAWGSVCDVEWDNVDAEVVCHELGFPRENAKATDGAMFGDGSGPTFLHDVACYGAENNLYECSYSGLGENDCDHPHYGHAGVICHVSNVILPVLSTQPATTTTLPTTKTLPLTTKATTQRPTERHQAATTERRTQPATEKHTHAPHSTYSDIGNDPAPVPDANNLSHVVIITAIVGGVIVVIVLSVVVISILCFCYTRRRPSNDNYSANSRMKIPLSNRPSVPSDNEPRKPNINPTGDFIGGRPLDNRGYQDLYSSGVNQSPYQGIYMEVV